MLSGAVIATDECVLGKLIHNHVLLTLSIKTRHPVKLVLRSIAPRISGQEFHVVQIKMECKYYRQALTELTNCLGFRYPLLSGFLRASEIDRFLMLGFCLLCDMRASYAASRYCFWRRLSVCLSAQYLENYRSESGVTW